MQTDMPCVNICSFFTTFESMSCASWVWKSLKLFFVFFLLVAGEEEEDQHESQPRLDQRKCERRNTRHRNEWNSLKFEFAQLSFVLLHEHSTLISLFLLDFWIFCFSRVNVNARQWRKVDTKHKTESFFDNFKDRWKFRAPSSWTWWYRFCAGEVRGDDHLNFSFAKSHHRRHQHGINIYNFLLCLQLSRLQSMNFECFFFSSCWRPTSQSTMRAKGGGMELDG